jgi:hypothetical protein
LIKHRIHKSVGFLRVTIELHTKDKLEHIDLSSTSNDEFLNDDDRLLGTMERFKHQSKHLLV